MRYCIRIPRILIPDGGFEAWAVNAPNAETADRGYWERQKNRLGEKPTALNLTLPEVFFGEEDEERVEEIHENMYTALEKHLVKLNRGAVLVERTTENFVRRGIIAAIDLEEYTFGRGEYSLIRPAQSPSRSRIFTQLRRGAPIEVPHAVIFYEDGRDRVSDVLFAERLEELYDFDLAEGGGHLSGSFVPESLADSLVRAMHSRQEPCFAVAEGNDYICAAKLYWDELKEKLSERERRNHPARFALAEFVNIESDEVRLRPMHRVLSEIDAEAFLSYFSAHINCRREGNVLVPSLPAIARSVVEIDSVIATFLRTNGGKIGYVRGAERLREQANREDAAGVAIRVPDKEELFDLLRQGDMLPRNTFTLGREGEQRYLLEAREISYD